jgi:hypothetical protein
MAYEKKVFVIIAKEFTLEEVKQEIKEEEYDFAFHFEGDIQLIDECDEVWTWGEVEDMALYKICKEYGTDIWAMN